MKKHVAIVCAVALMLCGIVACTPSETPEGSTTPTTTADATTTVTTDAPTDAPTDGTTEATTAPTEGTVAPTEAPTTARPTTTTTKITTTAKPTTASPYSENNIEFYGRFLKSADGWQFDWSGSAIEAGFNGTKVELQINLVGGVSTDYFNVYIDGGEPTMLTVNNAQDWYTLAEDLPKGYHWVRLEKRTEGPQGAICEFVQFDFPKGKAAPAPARKTRTIEFMGDSITAAYGNMAGNGWSGFKLIDEDFANSYGALTAKNLNAYATVLGWSGGGMYQDLGGNKTTVFSNNIFWRTLARKDKKDWTFEQKPDVLVINLGTNDFASKCDPEQYSICYENFLRELRKIYPDTHIVCTMGIIGVGYNANDHIQAAITYSGIDNVSFFMMFVDNIPESEKWGADGHPSAKAHAEMAAQLSEHIAQQMGW